ncbi:MAG: hypothetical protein JKY00_14005 [Roseicyclus sp.]|nr:hypothetical protein [Roseicyclus sp.]
MNLVVVIGFAAIGGILAGYVTARLGPRWMIWVLWAGCLLIGLGAVLWMQSLPNGGGADGVVILYGILAPFTGCAFIAGIIAMVARAAIAGSKDP